MLAAIVAMAIGFGVRWVSPDMSQPLPGPAVAEPATDVAVADTPFEELPPPTTGKLADASDRYRSGGYRPRNATKLSQRSAARPR